MDFRRLLLSRKRKLSELYYATVSLGDHVPSTKNPQYQENERLFLDANDIEKYDSHCVIYENLWQLQGLASWKV